MVETSTTQHASAAVDSGQFNVSTPVTVGGTDHDHQWRLSAPTAGDDGGGGGDVTQSNTADNTAIAANLNSTDQFVEQAQAASGSGGGQDQSATLDNTSRPVRPCTTASATSTPRCRCSARALVAVR